jgi:hypothetical protein
VAAVISSAGDRKAELMAQLEPIVNWSGSWYLPKGSSEDGPEGPLIKFLRVHSGCDTQHFRRILDFLVMQWQDMKDHQHKLPVGSLIDFQEARTDIMRKSERAYLRGMYQVALARSFSDAALQRADGPAKRQSHLIDSISSSFMCVGVVPYGAVFELLRIFKQESTVSEATLFPDDYLKTQTLDTLAQTLPRHYRVDRGQSIGAQLKQAQEHLARERAESPASAGLGSWDCRSLTEMVELLKSYAPDRTPPAPPADGAQAKAAVATRVECKRPDLSAMLTPDGKLRAQEKPKRADLRHIGPSVTSVSRPLTSGKSGSGQPVNAVMLAKT